MYNRTVPLNAFLSDNVDVETVLSVFLCLYYTQVQLVLATHKP